MGLWRSFKMTGDLKVAVHALLLLSPEFARTIITHKGQWMKSARASIERGERVGDVAAIVVIDYITSSVATNPAARELIASDLLNTDEFAELLKANQAIVGMISNAKVLSEPDYSPTLGYVIAHRYAHALFEPHNRDVIVQDLMDRAEAHRRWIVTEFNAAKVGTPPRLPPAHSLAKEHLDIVQDKLNYFVRHEYKPKTEQSYENYAAALSTIDDCDPEAPQVVQLHTDAFRNEIHRLNEWAWEAARKLIDGDISQMETSLGSNMDQETAERCADIVEHTIEGHTKALIAAVSVCQTKKLDAIDRGSTSTQG